MMTETIFAGSGRAFCLVSLVIQPDANLSRLSDKAGKWPSVTRKSKRGS